MNQNSELKIDEFTSPLPFKATEEMTVGEALQIMNKEGFRHLPIVEGKKPVGIISQRDLIFIQNFEGGVDWPLSKCMVKDPYCVVSGSLIDQVALEMSRRKIGSALVTTSSGELDGIFTSTDGLNALIEVIRGEV